MPTEKPQRPIDTESSTDPNLSSALSQAGTRFKRGENGEVDVMDAVGGVRGMVEALLPGFLFLCVFIATANLYVALAAAGSVALVFSLVRLAQRGSLVQSLSGFVGVLICAWSSLRTGDAADFYLPGLLLNGLYALLVLVSIVFRWPVLGFFYSFLRNESETWRAEPARLKAYTVATWVIFAMFVARLAVQVPLYFADNVPLLGIARLFMGMPLYIALLWLTWMITRKPADVASTDLS